MKCLTAGKNEEGVRLSRFVLQVTKDLPNGLLYKSFRKGRIKVNGRRAAPDSRLVTGDVVELYLNDEFFPQGPPSPTSSPITAGPLPTFSVVWEDASIAILYKPAGVLCHADEGGHATLLDAFTARLAATGEYDPAIENSFAPALCNRLDRGTEGLVIAAKTYAALRDMNELLREGSVSKRYLCITCGRPPQGLHEAFLSRDKTAKRVTVGPAQCEGAKPIATQVRIAQTCGRFALCEVELLTGRTHQIRAHLAYLGASLLGDGKYGDAALNRQLGLRRQALCAYKLSFAPVLPTQNSLAHLAGMQFTAEDAQLPQLWAKLCAAEQDT